MNEVVEREKDEEEREVMDTPERSKSGQIAVPLSKFEESPVFSFLNSLSPIEPVKLMNISQTINPLNFASPPLVFASPHVGSLRESRFLQRHHLQDPSKPEFSSINGNENREETKLVVESAQNLSHECNNPSSGLNHNIDPLTRSSDPMNLVPLAQESSQGASYVREDNIDEAVYQIDQNNEATPCDWESLIDASDLLIFDSPNVTAESSRKSIDREKNLYTSTEHDMHQMTSEFGPSNESDNICTQPGETNDMPEYTENFENVADPCMNNAGERIDYEHLPGLYRGRRRCLVFEGARMKHLDNKNSSSSSVSTQSDCNIPANEEQPLALTNTGNDSSNRVLPGIGLHLNAIAATPRDYKIINQDSSASGRLLIGQSSSSVNLQTSSPGQELMTIDDNVPVHSLERDIVNEEVNPIPNSPKKKRQRDQASEVEACKRCNCKKSKCLKLYCECFAAGVYCVEPCSCIDCFNKPIHEDTVLATRKQIESRNPLAFAPKVIRGSDPISETGVDSTKTPASARHKRGCNCKKSGCHKKYCECYQSGVGCSLNCRCEGCKNAFGRKDGSGVIAMELEVEEDETDKNEKTILNVDSAPPSTPLQATRQPFSSKEKPPRSSFPSNGPSSSSSSSSCSIYTNKGCNKTSSQFDTIREEDDGEIPDFLQENSPIDGVKSSSPNRKRVSPPRSIVTQSPSKGLRSSRKLILRSIPSFPSLTTNQ